MGSAVHSSTAVKKAWFHANTIVKQSIGFIGLGKMGSGMARNAAEQGYEVVLFDVDDSVAKGMVKSLPGARIAASPAEVAAQTSTIISMVPNDECLKSVVTGKDGLLIDSSQDILHISCSTVSPFTSRELSNLGDVRYTHISAPVFARPDGIERKEAYFPISGGTDAVRKQAIELLSSTSSNAFDFGDDPGAANVVKLCGNYMIAASIQSLAESLALAENNGLDRVQVMDMLTSTIFNCLIYKGYGQRVAMRDHKPGGFALELGLKDVTLVLDTAHKSKVTMPVGSVLHDRWLASYAKGRGAIDWSAVGLSVSEDSGVDVSLELRDAIESATAEKPSL